MKKPSMRFVNVVLLCFIILSCSSQLHAHKSDELSPETVNNGTITMEPENAYSKNRKILMNEYCSNRDISISQSTHSTTGMPQFIVQIANTCVFGCAPSRIHLHCGWFASAKMVNPTIFKRLSYDDCLVNGGNPMKPNQIISFTYANSFMYPLSLKSAKFC